MKVPEKYRFRKGQMGSDSSYGNNGVFVIPHYKISDYEINCIVSDGMGWQHVSVTLSKKHHILTGNGRKTGTHRNISVERCATWEEMCFVKGLFWDNDETVIQFHPPESEYVNNHKYCLHLWKPDNVELPLPDSLMVGIKTN